MHLYYSQNPRNRFQLLFNQDAVNFFTNWFLKSKEILQTKNTFQSSPPVCNFVKCNSVQGHPLLKR